MINYNDPAERMINYNDLAERMIKLADQLKRNREEKEFLFSEISKKILTKIGNGEVSFLFDDPYWVLTWKGRNSKGERMGARTRLLHEDVLACSNPVEYIVENFGNFVNRLLERENKEE